MSNIIALEQNIIDQVIVESSVACSWALIKNKHYYNEFPFTETAVINNDKLVFKLLAPNGDELEAMTVSSKKWDWKSTKLVNNTSDNVIHIAFS